MTGWLCARCGTSWAPHVRQCDCAPAVATNTIRLTPFEEAIAGTAPALTAPVYVGHSFPTPEDT